MTGEGKERKELPESEEELSLLLALAEQCRADGCLEAAFIFIKRTGNGAFGLARLLSSPPACLAAGGVGEPPLPMLPVGTGSWNLTIHMLALITAACIYGPPLWATPHTRPVCHTAHFTGEKPVTERGRHLAKVTRPSGGRA